MPGLLKNCARSLAETALEVRGSVLEQAAMLAGWLLAAAQRARADSVAMRHAMLRLRPLSKRAT